MFDSSFDFQPTQSQPQVETSAEYPYASNSSTTAPNCQHRDLQEILDSGIETKAAKHTLKGGNVQSQTFPMSAMAKSCGDVDKLREYSPSASRVLLPINKV